MQKLDLVHFFHMWMSVSLPFVEKTIIVLPLFNVKDQFVDLCESISWLFMLFHSSHFHYLGQNAMQV